MTSALWDQTEGTGAQQEGGGEMERQRDMLGRGGSKKEEGGRQRHGQGAGQVAVLNTDGAQGHGPALHTLAAQGQGPLGNLWHLAWKVSGMGSAFPQTSTLVTCHLWKQG